MPVHKFGTSLSRHKNKLKFAFAHFYLFLFRGSFLAAHYGQRQKIKKRPNAMKRIAARTAPKIRDNKIKFLAVAIAMKWLVKRLCTHADDDMQKATMLLDKARAMTGSNIDEFSLGQAKCTFIYKSNSHLSYFFIWLRCNRQFARDRYIRHCMQLDMIELVLRRDEARQICKCANQLFAI